MRKTRKILSLVLSIAMVISMFTFVMPTTASAAISNSFDGSGTLWINNSTTKLDCLNNVGSIGGKSADDVVGYVAVKDGVTPGSGGDCYFNNPWGGGGESGNRVLMAMDVYFTDPNTQLCFEYHRTYEKDGAVTTQGMNQFVHIGPAYGIKRGNSHLPVVDENAPTSLDTNKWYNIAVEVANDGTKEVNIYINGEKYACEMHDVSIKAHRFRMNFYRGGMYYDNYYCNDDAQGVDMYPEEEYIMSDISVAESDKFTYDEATGQFTLIDETLTAGELKEAISSDYAVTVYKNAKCETALADTDTVSISTVVAATNGDKLFRYYDFYRENNSIFEYVANGDGVSCTVLGYKADSIPEEGSALVIPETIAGYTVTGIAGSAFRVEATYSGVELSSITMPDTVTDIGGHAFFDTYASVTAWPKALEKIGAYAFEHGGNMPGAFPAGLKSIGEGAFRFSALGADIKALELPDGLETIGDSAFWWCGSVKTLVIPDSVTSLGDGVAGLMHSGLNTIRFPRNDTITEIPANSITAGNYTTNATRLFQSMSIYIPETIITIPDNLVRDFADGATVTIYGQYGSAAYSYYEKIKAALEEGTYYNLASYGEEGAYTDSDADGKGELAGIRFAEYNFAANTDFSSSDINKGDKSPGLATVTNDSVITANTPGVGGKTADDVVLRLDTMGGSGGQNYFSAGSAEGTKTGVFYHEVSVMAPEVGAVGVQFGTYTTTDLKDDPDGDGVKDGYYNLNPDAFKVAPDGIYVLGTKVMDAEAGRWYTIATEIACDGTTAAAVYVNGTRYEAELDKPAYGVRHFRVYPHSNSETYQIYYDNIRAYRSTAKNYNTLGDVPATVTSNSDSVTVYKAGIVYADETAVYTAGELKGMLETDEFSRANVRIYSDNTYLTELADEDTVTNDSIVVVAATNGFDIERVYSYYSINPLVNTTIYDIDVIDEEAKTARVTGFYAENLVDTDDLSSIAIPEKVMGYTITEIGNNAFYGNTEIQSVVIPDTVTKIGSNAFGNNQSNGTAHGNISSVKMSKNIKEIGDGAFKCNGSLKSIDLPDGLETIGASAFYWTGLTEISLPNSLTSLGSQAFRLTGSLKYLKLSSGITEYTNQFYSNGLKLEDLIIPASVTSIGDLALTDLTKYEMDPVVYGVEGTFAEEYAETNGWEFVNIIANTIVATRAIYGDDSKELTGSDYDIKHGYEKFTFKGKLINIGDTDTEAYVIIALYNAEGAMLERELVPVTIPAGETVVIDETTGVSVPAENVADGYKVKAFVWRKSNIEPISEAVEIEFDADKREIHVLHIANSFGNDSFGYINDIAEADGIVLKVQNMYIGGAKVTQHYRNMLTDAANYQPVINTVYGSTKITVDEALRSDKWDVVALQAATHGQNSNDYAFIDYATWADDANGSATGTPNITTAEIFEYIESYVEERAPDAKKIMHMSWGPCEAESKEIYGARFAEEEDASGAVFEAQKAAYEYASTIYADEANMMVPTSYAVQYALNTLGYQEHSGPITGEKYDDPVAGEISIYRDETCHLTIPVGRVLVGLTWYEYLTGNDVRENPYQNSAISADVMAKLKEAAHWANTQVVPITGSAAQ